MDVNHVLQENMNSMIMAKCLRTLEQALGHIENRALRSVFYRLIIRKQNIGIYFVLKPTILLFRGKYKEVQRIKV